MTPRFSIQQPESRAAREYRHDSLHTSPSSILPPPSTPSHPSTHVPVKSGLPKPRHSSQRQPYRDYQSAYRIQNKGSSNFEKARPQVPCSRQPQGSSLSFATQPRVATSQTSTRSDHGISGAGSLQECVQLVRAKVADARLKLLALERLEQSINFLSEAGSDEPIVSTLITWLQTDTGSGPLGGARESTEETQQRSEQANQHVFQQVLAAAQTHLIANPQPPPIESPPRLELDTHLRGEVAQHNGNSESVEDRGTCDAEHRIHCEVDDEQDSVLGRHFTEFHEDLRDTTLSEMDMHRKLALLVYGGGDASILNGDQHTRKVVDQNFKVAEEEQYQANTTSDETQQFMIRLENVQNEVSWLAAETNPANAYGNFSFMSCTDPEEEADTSADSNQQDYRQSSPLKSSMTILPEDLTKRSLSNGHISVPAPAESPLKDTLLESHSTQALISIQKSQDGLQRLHQTAPTIQGLTPSLPSSPVSAGASCLRISIPSHLPTSTRFDTNPQFGTPVSAYSSAKEELSQSLSSVVGAQSRMSSESLKRETGSSRTLAETSTNASERDDDGSMIASTVFAPTASFDSSNHGSQPRGIGIVHYTRSSTTDLAGEETQYWSPTSPTLSGPSSRSTSSSFSRRSPALDCFSRASSPLCPQPLSTWSLSLSDQFHSQGQDNNTLPPTLESRRSSSTRLPSIRHQHGWLGFQSLDIYMVASGRCHIVAVTRSNQVFTSWEPDNDNDTSNRIEANDGEIEETLGRNVKTDTGTRATQDTAFRPGLVVFNEKTGKLPSKIVKVACSDSSTFVLTENGDLWGWGSFENTDGTKVAPLGPSSIARPVQIFTRQVKDVVCGGNHVLILVSSGSIVSWGTNDHCQLGRPASTSSLSLQEAANTDLAPYLVRKASQCILGAGTVTSPRILGIGAGKRTSFAWDEKRLSGWGDNTSGQLYVSGIDAVIYPRYVMPCLLNGNAIKQVRGGEGHTAILKLDGSVVTVGNNHFGQFGPSRTSYLETHTGKRNSRSEATTSGETNSRSSSLQILPSGIKEICCGDFCTVVRTNSEEMFTWGGGVTIHCLERREATVGTGSRANNVHKPAMASRAIAISAMRNAMIAFVP